ncbi:hypothetical protein N9115_02590 [bacterium]|nr:hypothetical protein [Akkermansiaceae bacterium]MDB4492230.1 hypothetical protein [bacterium]MDB4499135.1 hypothetical protein [Akkermansiaceae bacterium]MDB4577534.1 hypothetical protein [bacterium]MDB4597247.1 hypothetical protein [Akkermansiaceae bacterium]
MKFAAFFVALALCSCAEVSIVDQPQLSRPAMSFGETGALSADCALTSQVEKGRSLTNASASGGCSSCH